MAAEEVRTLYSIVLCQASIPHRVALLLIWVEENMVVEVSQSDFWTVLRIATHRFGLRSSSLEDGQVRLVVDLPDLALRRDDLVDQVCRKLTSTVNVTAYNFHLDRRIMGKMKVSISLFVPAWMVNFGVALTPEMIFLESVFLPLCINFLGLRTVSTHNVDRAYREGRSRFLMSAIIMQNFPKLLHQLTLLLSGRHCSPFSGCSFVFCTDCSTVIFVTYYQIGVDRFNHCL